MLQLCPGAHRSERSSGTVRIDKRWEKFQLPSSYGLGETVLWRYLHKYKGSVSELVDKLIHYEAVCRTALATPSLFKMYRVFFSCPEQL